MSQKVGKHLFCFGMGYSASALAQSLQRKGWRISGTCRSPEKQARLRALAIDAVIFDRARSIPGLAARLRDVTHLLSSVPPDEQGDPVIDCHGPDIAAAANQLAWLGYLSTTGVYGDRGGGWVDETSALTPSGERGRRRVAAEGAWLAMPQAAHVFRLAGIYGPGSSALDTVRSGRAKRVVKPGQVFSRIHVDDIVQTIEASIERPNPGQVYNVCDDDPAPPSEVIAFACDLLNAPLPPEIDFQDADLSAMARSFYDDNKRVRNDRLKSELGVTLKYPDYRLGLTAIRSGKIS